MESPDWYETEQRDSVPDSPINTQGTWTRKNKVLRSPSGTSFGSSSLPRSDGRTMNYDHKLYLSGQRERKKLCSMQLLCLNRAGICGYC